MLYSWDWVLDFVKACAKMAVIWVISTILAIVLDSCGIRAENLLLVYLLGVLISILATSSLAWALCAAIVFTFTFNYLFTEPKLTFHMDDVNYVVSSIVFVAAASIVATLVVKLQKQMQTIMTQYTSTLTAQLQKELSTQLQSQLGNLASSMQDAIQIDASVFSKAIKMNMNEEELSELMMSLMTTEVSSYDGNLKNLGYADLDKPGGISIYPKNFESKQKVIDVLDGYNANMEKVDEDKVISYTDYVGTLMSSVTDIINVISYVLIAFVAISLVVSSIMIGVITYISVLERKKEIGILRAIGASKKNISQVFNAETFIIGLLAGLLGIIITLLLLIPGNMLIHHLAGNVEVSAALPLAGGVILIVLSVILTLIGGLIPSKKAAQEDPVTALRTE